MTIQKLKPSVPTATSFTQPSDEKIRLTHYVDKANSRSKFTSVFNPLNVPHAFGFISSLKVSCCNITLHNNLAWPIWSTTKWHIWEVFKHIYSQSVHTAVSPTCLHAASTANIHHYLDRFKPVESDICLFMSFPVDWKRYASHSLDLQVLSAADWLRWASWMHFSLWC